MSDSKDGSSEVPSKSPDLGAGNSESRERHAEPSATDVGAQLPPVPGGVMERAAAKPTTGVGTSLVPSTEPSAELAARAQVGTEAPAEEATATEAQGQSPAPPSDAPAEDAGPESAPASVAPSTRGALVELVEPVESRASEPSVLQVLAPHLTEEQVAARRKDKLRGLVIIGVTFVACILLSVWGKEQAEPEESLPPRPPTTEGLVGWPDKVDPFAALALARSISQRDLLRGIVAEHVARDGTVDFKDKKGTGSVRFAFQSEPGHGPQPPRDPGKVPPRSYCGKQNVHIRRHGIVADPDVPSFPCPAKPRDSLPNPECTTRQIWDFAAAQGLPTDKPARIEYFAARSGPAYRLTVSASGAQRRVVVASDCKTELKTREAHGGVP